MQITFDNPATVPAPVGTYSHVGKLTIGDGTLLFVAGQLAVDSAGRLVGDGSMAEQAKFVLETIGEILEAHGATFGNVVNIRTFLTDMDAVGDYVAVRSKYFTGDLPTSTTVEISRLAIPGVLIEIEVVAAC
ncbi:RidA family protein [Amycolatopsis sp. NPDC059021]|uniref:RidA family protein n=1 Tax=Amycolatopsis sp. NPDC059021 TaxID=3346704 RepID=UPI00367195D2